MTATYLLNMTIEMLSFPIKTGDVQRSKTWNGCAFQKWVNQPWPYPQSLVNPRVDHGIESSIIMKGHGSNDSVEKT